MISKAIFARLSDGASATFAIVGNNDAGTPNVYPDVNLAKGTRFVVYEADDGESAMTFSGPSGMTQHTAIISAVGGTALECEEAAEAIKTDLDGQRGTWGGIDVPGAFLETGDAQLYELSPGAERRLYGKDLQFLIWKRT